MSKRIKIIFTLSLLLNVLFLAAAGGAVYKHSQRKHKPFSEMHANLSEDAQNILRAKMRDGKGKFIEWRKQAHEHQQKMESIISAQDFDREAYMSEASKIAAVNAQKNDERIEKTADLLEQLSYEDRMLMAKHIARQVSGVPMHKREDNRSRQRPERPMNRMGRE